MQVSSIFICLIIKLFASKNYVMINFIVRRRLNASAKPQAPEISAIRSRFEIRAIKALSASSTQLRCLQIITLEREETKQNPTFSLIRSTSPPSSLLLCGRNGTRPALKNFYFAKSWMEAQDDSTASIVFFSEGEYPLHYTKPF